jgi:hypothetical protein
MMVELKFRACFFAENTSQERMVVLKNNMKRSAALHSIMASRKTGVASNLQYVVISIF